MRPCAHRIESYGSVWFLDDHAGEYLRMPKQEGPRESPPGEDWGGPDAGALQDLVWHPMACWEIRPVGMFDRLVIWLDDDHDRSVSAPIGPNAVEVRA